MRTKNNPKLASELNVFIADLQIHYQNLRAFHWNVKGNMFFVLHEKFEEYYTEVAQTIDEVAERVLMIGGEPLHTFSDYLEVATIKEAKGVTDGIEAIKITVEQNEVLLSKLEAIFEIAEGDEATLAMLSDLISATEKKLWMLRTFLA